MKKSQSKPQLIVSLLILILATASCERIRADAEESYYKEQKNSKAVYALTYKEQKEFERHNYVRSRDVFAKETEIKEYGLAVAILVDISGSMEYALADNYNKTKLEAAKETFVRLIDEIYAWIEARPDIKLQIGLYAFDDYPRVLMPIRKLSQKTCEIMKIKVNSLEKGRGGTAIGKALAQASRELFKTGYANKHIFVLTDGVNTNGHEPRVIAPRIVQRSERSIQLHFVAFDMDPRYFDFLKEPEIRGTIAEAQDEATLKKVVPEVFRKNILVEKEDFMKALVEREDYKSNLKKKEKGGR